MIDLRNAISCIKAMKENGTYDGQKIGRVIEPYTGAVILYEPSHVVLFKEEESDDKRKTLIIESPLCEKGLRERREMGSKVTTVGKTSNVPRRIIEEIIFPDGYLD